MRNILASAVIAMAAPVAANAAVLDLSPLTVGLQGTQTLDVDGASIRTTGQDIVVADLGDLGLGLSAGYCVGILTGCTAETVVEFDSPVADLSLAVSSLVTTGSLSASIFNETSLLDTVSITEDAEIDFAGYSGITSLLLGSEVDTLLSIGATAFVGDIAFEDDPAAVPLPAGGLLLFTALGGLAALRRRVPGA